MPITDFQRRNRKNHIGSSDAAAIVGLNKWKSAGDVFIEKTQDLPERDMGEAALIGTLWEDPCLQWFAKDSGKKILRNQLRVHQNGFMAAHLDALVVDTKEIVEAKVIGILTPFDRDQWGNEDSDQIPEQYIVQCQHELAVAGPEYETVYLPVLLGGVGFVKYRVQRNPDLIRELEAIETNFWKYNVQAGLPPPDSPPHMEVIRSLKRTPNKIVPLDSGLVENWLKAKEFLKMAETTEDLAKRAMISALGDAEQGDADIGTLTYYTQERASFVAKATSFRVPRFKRAK